MAGRPLKKTNTSKIDKVAKDFSDVKSQIAILSDRQKELQDEMLILLEDFPDGYTLTTDTEQIRFARVVGTRMVVNEDRLKKALGVTLWNKITSKVLDKAKLDAFVKSGEINPTQIANATTISQNSPYVKVTKK